MEPRPRERDGTSRHGVRCSRVAAVALATCAVLVGSAATAVGAHLDSASGDACSAAGNGTNAYTLSIMLPSDGPQQSGFALGVSGAKIRNISVSSSGLAGDFSTADLPAGTTRAVTFSTPPMLGGPVVLVVTTSSGGARSFTVVPMSSPSGSFFTRVLCAISKGSAASNAFMVERAATYDPASGAWHELVTVPGPGVVRSVENVATAGTTPVNALVTGGHVHARSAGTFALTIRPTGEGKAELKARGLIKVLLSVTFLPKNGNASDQLVQLTLRR